MSGRKLKVDPFPRWSCKQKDRNECRDPDGCHCREIEALNETLRGKEALIAATLQMVRRLEREARGAAALSRKDEGGK